MFGPYNGFQSARLAKAEMLKQLRLLETAIRKTQADVDAGKSQPSALEAQMETLGEMKSNLAAVEAQIQREALFEALQRPVELRLIDATVQQVAAALTKATQLPIVVDEQVSNEQRMTLNIRRVSLARVLQTVASSGNLMLAPYGTPWKGVEIAPWPSLAVGNQRQTFFGPMAPWNEEWGVSPTGDILLPPQPTEAVAGDPAVAPGGKTPDIEAPAPGAAKPPTPDEPTPGVTAPSVKPETRRPEVPGLPRFQEGPLPSPTPEGFGGMGGFGGGMGMGGGYPGGGFGVPLPAGLAVSLTSPSPNLLVVAEAGVKDGAGGVYLTLYRIDGGSLKRIGSTFHRFTGQQPPSGMMPGMPGGWGRSLSQFGGGGSGEGPVGISGSFPPGGGRGLDDTPVEAIPPGGGGAAPARPVPMKPRLKPPSQNRRRQPLGLKVPEGKK
jgi:hypothetical protein